MGINSAIGNALSGLRVTSRNAEIVSRNVSNAMTAGYTQKTLGVSHQVNGLDPGGVRADGVRRAGDPFLTAARRRDEAAAQNLSAQSEGLRRIADLVLDPQGGDSLHSRYLAFENSLRALADTPESAALQREVADAGRAVAQKLNMLSGEATRIRMDADSDIQRQVETVNRAMRQIAQLNRDIQSAYAADRDASALEDERDRQIDLVNTIIPIKQTRTVNGGMLVTTEGGAMLMNGSTPYALSFEPSGLGVDGSNALNGLTIMGRTTGDVRALGLDGGTLEAAFATRDVHAPTFSGQLDAIAADLAERFQSAGFMTDYIDDLDGLLTPEGDPTPDAIGLFTDPETATLAAPDGGRYEIANLAGFAGRITFNVTVDPRAGGDPGALATGAYTGAPTPDTTTPGADPQPFFATLYAAFTAQRELTADGPDPGGALGLVGRRAPVEMVTEWASLLEVSAGARESEASFRLGAAEALRDEETAKMGVDTDEEMRQLLLIEKAYAANAQVLQVADQMLAELLSIR
jgi:flagellar hook-associated protein 1 FlgK